MTKPALKACCKLTALAVMFVIIPGILFFAAIQGFLGLNEAMHGIGPYLRGWTLAISMVGWMGLAICFCVLMGIGVVFAILLGDQLLDQIKFLSYLRLGGKPQLWLAYRSNPALYSKIAFTN